MVGKAEGLVLEASSHQVVLLVRIGRVTPSSGLGLVKQNNLWVLTGMLQQDRRNTVAAHSHTQ
jgi:hypothetical protein